MKKNILSVLVTLSMLLSLVPVSYAADNSNAAYAINAGSYSVVQGENITLTFSVSGIEQVSSIAAKIKYDPEKLSLVSSSKGTIYRYSYTDSVSSLTGGDEYGALGALVAFKNGEYHDASSDVLFTATFKAAESLEAGTYTDLITVSEAVAYRGDTKYQLQGNAPAITVTQAEVPAYPLTVSADKRTARMGEDIKYTISAANEIDLSGLEIHLGYDKSILKFKEGTLIDGTTSDVTEDALVWTNSETKKVSGAIATLTYTAVSNGSAAISAVATSAPTPVKVVFPTVTVGSDVSISVNADKDQAEAGDVITYTVNLDKDATIAGLELSFDFSKYAIKDCTAEYGAILGDVANSFGGASFEDKVAKVTFGTDRARAVSAGVLASFSMTLEEDIDGSIAPVIKDNKVSGGDNVKFAADVDVDAVDPAPETAVLNVVPAVAEVRTGDTVEYTVSIGNAVSTEGLQIEMAVDPRYVEGDISVEEVNDVIKADYSQENGKIVAVALAMGEKVEVSGDLFKFSFQAKASEDAVITPVAAIKANDVTLTANVTPVKVNAKSSAAVDVKSSTEYVLPGGTVTYSFDLKDAKALKMLSFDIEYDPEKYVSAVVNKADAAPLKIFETGTTETPGKITVVYTAETPFSGSCEGIVTVEFKATDTPAEVGDDGVKIEVKSDELTDLTVTNTARASIVNGYGHIVVTTDKTVVKNTANAEPIVVTVKAENITDLRAISFEITYDKNLFYKKEAAVTNDGGNAYDIEEGRIRYIYADISEPLNGDMTLVTFKLYPVENAAGTMNISVENITRTVPVDAVGTVGITLEPADNLTVKLIKGEEGYSVESTLLEGVEADPIVVVAVYDNEDVLVSAKAAKASEASSLVVAADTANTTAEIYVWTSLDEMAPYNDCSIIK